MLQMLGRGMSLTNRRKSLLPLITTPPLFTEYLVWLDASDKTTIHEDDNTNRVSQIDDKSGNSIHAVQANTTWQPHTNVRTLHGKNVIESRDDSLLNLGDIGIDPSTDDFTIISVHATDAWANYGTLWSFGSSHLRLTHSNQNKVFFIDSGAAGGINFVGSSSFGATPHISNITRDVTSTEVRYNETQVYTGAPNYASSNSFTIFSNTADSATYSLDGYFAELIIIPRKLSVSELQSIESYLAAKWEIASSISNDMVLAADGQSLIDYQFTQSGGSGAANTVTALQSYFSGAVEFVNGSLGATALLKIHASPSFPDRWYYDHLTGEFGPVYYLWEAAVTGKTVRALIHDQGTQDAGFIGSTYSNFDQSVMDLYEEANIILFNKFRSVVGNVPIIICPIGRTASGFSSGRQGIRELQYRMPTLMDGIYIMGGKTQYDLVDSVHLTQTGREALGTTQGHFVGKLLGRTGTTPTIPPHISAVSRSGTTVTITVRHEEGADFVPNAGDIDGFVFYDGGYPAIGGTTTIGWSTPPTYINATTIEGVLNSAPSSNEYLIYQFAGLIGVDNTKLVLDNTALALPLAPAVFEDTGSGFTKIAGG